MEYPIGHARRRSEGTPLLLEKFTTNLARVFAEPAAAEIRRRCLDYEAFVALSVNEFTDMLALK